MRIAQLIIRFWPAVGGAEEHCLEISKRLVKDGHKVDVFTSDLRSEWPWEKLGNTKNSVEGITIKRFNTVNRIYPWLKGLWKELNKEKYDVIYAYSMPKSYTDLAALYSRKTGTPLIVSTVGFHFHEDPRNPNIFLKVFKKLALKGYYSLVGRKVLEQARFIHVFSTQEKNFIAGLGVATHKVRVIPSGINWKSYQKKRKFNDKGFLLFVGRIDKGKGLNYLVEAMKGTKERLLIIGDNFGYEDELKELVKKLGLQERVLFYGHASEEEKIGALQHCKALVLPSRYESFGRVLVEAMACGKPVVATKVGGIPDFVKGTVPYGDVGALRRAILHPRKQEGDGRRFDWANIYKRTLKMYEQALN